MPDPTQSDDFAVIKRLGVHELVKSMDEYQHRVSGALSRTVNYLLPIDTLKNLTTEEVCTAHYLAFHTVHPWAGALRTEKFPDGVKPKGADPSRIEPELELARLQMRALVHHNYPALAIISFYYARFEMIQPFKGGNSTIGRMISGVQIVQSCSPPETWNVETGPEYDKAQEQAMYNFDLAPLANIMARAIGFQELEGEWPSPFRMEPIAEIESMLLAPATYDRAFLTPQELLPKTLRRT